MYDHLRPHSREYRWGRYFETVPSLPLKNSGRPFRFCFSTGSKGMDDLVSNLEHLSTDLTITTTYDYNWSVDGAMLIDGKLYKIQDGITSEVVPDQSNAIARSVRRRFTIRLKEISNPIGLRR